ncbi:MAG: glycosyl hydrolase family 32 [Candidatus Dormibacteraeota bacterium]|nr:glycosyl hydrolase family 32 [Candidatus Dormibacteraeota bacterium]
MHSLRNRWIWDFWLVTDADAYHVFYLQAPRSLGNPDLRHNAATIGHAVSSDLRTWTTLPDAIGAGDPGAFDDLATWTGSIVRAGDVWMLFYTGISRREHGRVQRIGAARSSDLVSWERVDGLLLEADPRWYEVSGNGETEAWRDPWAFRDERTGRHHLFITARVNHGPADGRGVIGHAWSDDLFRWTVGPPVSQPGEFFHLEVPQTAYIGDRHRLFFCAPEWGHSGARLGRTGVRREGGTHYLVADDLLGPYGPEREDFLLGDEVGRHYAGRVIATPDGWMMLAWAQYGPDGTFAGSIGDPMPLHVDAVGQLRVDLT